MARKTNSQRDFTTPNQSLAQLLSFKIRPAPLLLPVFTPSAVLDSGDRRVFQPDRSIAPPHTPVRSSSRVVAPLGGRLSTLRFQDPKLVAICVRRKQRKEVLFAKRKTRKGAGSRKHRNFWSDIKC